jgi:DNA-binding NarL/FixJ family response regulator
MIRVLIVDDHPVVRDGLRSILETAPNLTLVGEATNGEEGVRLAAELLPDVVLMDLRMPGLDGIGAIEQIKANRPDVAIVILTTYDDDERSCAPAGARYLSRTPAEVLVRRDPCRPCASCCRTPSRPGSWRTSSS